MWGVYNLWIFQYKQSETVREHGIS